MDRERRKSFLNGEENKSQKLGRGVAGKYEIKQLYTYTQLQIGTERAP